MSQLMATAPWLLLVGSLLFLLRRRPRLQDYPTPPDARDPAGPAVAVDGAAPRVSIILPTRDDATRVGICLATLLDCDYPDFEILVVDHGSADGTREIVQALGQRSPELIRLLPMEGVSAGGGWRARACMRGAEEATGELLLFTDPGTVHESELLGRAVSALEAESADLLSVQPRLTMQGFRERLILPHAWIIHRSRFPSARLVNRARSLRNAVGYHQFFLFRRAAYEAIGGHGRMEPDAVEDLALPQAVVGSGRRLFLVHGHEYLEARMARAFSGPGPQWPTAIPSVSRTTVAPWARPFLPWLLAVAPILFFVLPPVLLVAGLVSGSEPLFRWAIRATALSLLFWLVVYGVHRIRPAYAIIYPVGAMATAVLFFRSLIRPADPQ